MRPPKPFRWRSALLASVLPILGAVACEIGNPADQVSVRLLVTDRGLERCRGGEGRALLPAGPSTRPSCAVLSVSRVDEAACSADVEIACESKTWSVPGKCRDLPASDVEVWVGPPGSGLGDLHLRASVDLRGREAPDPRILQVFRSARPDQWRPLADAAIVLRDLGACDAAVRQDDSAVERVQEDPVSNPTPALLPPVHEPVAGPADGAGRTVPPKPRAEPSATASPAACPILAAAPAVVRSRPELDDRWIDAVPPPDSCPAWRDCVRGGKVAPLSEWTLAPGRGRERGRAERRYRCETERLSEEEQHARRVFDRARLSNVIVVAESPERCRSGGMGSVVRDVLARWPALLTPPDMAAPPSDPPFARVHFVRAEPHGDGTGPRTWLLYDNSGRPTGHFWSVPPPHYVPEGLCTEPIPDGPSQLHQPTTDLLVLTCPGAAPSARQSCATMDAAVEATLTPDASVWGEPDVNRLFRRVTGVDARIGDLDFRARVECEHRVSAPSSALRLEFQPTGWYREDREAVLSGRCLVGLETLGVREGDAAFAGLEALGRGVEPGAIRRALQASVLDEGGVVSVPIEELTSP